MAFFHLEGSPSARAAQSSGPEVDDDDEEMTQVTFDVTQDEYLYCGVLKWELTYKTLVEGSGLKFRTVAISQIGDFCVLAGDQVVSVWIQDSSLDSYTQQILYTEEEQED